MEKTYLYRIYPDETQRDIINRTMGAIRFVFNHYFTVVKDNYDSGLRRMTYIDMIYDFNKYKKQYPWMKSLDSRAFQNVLKELDNVFRRYWSNGGNSFPPRYKHYGSAVTRYKTTSNNNSIRLDRDRIKLPKLKWVRIENTQKISGRILNATVMRKPNDSYYVALCCTDVDEEKLPLTGNSIELSADEMLPIKSIDNFYNRYDRLKKRLERTEIGSNGRQKLQDSIIKLRHRIFNMEEDYLQKLTTRLVQENDTIKISSKSNSSIWYRFLRMMKYKAEWYGRNLVIAK